MGVENTEERAVRIQDNNPVFRKAVGFTRKQEILWNEIFDDAYTDANDLDDQKNNTNKLTNRIAKRLSGIEHDDLVRLAAGMVANIVVNS